MIYTFFSSYYEKENETIRDGWQLWLTIMIVITCIYMHNF